MSIDLSKVKQRDIVNCEYTKAKEIVEALELIKPFKYKSIDAVEELEGYLSNALIIKSKIMDGDFKSDCKEREKKELIQRLDYIIDHFNSALEINITLINQSAQVTKWIDDAKTQLDEQKEEIERKAKFVQEQIDNSEHTILSHVLTLMGIFSAIITIILSVIITSSSWINNSDKADAVVAFVVPNAVALMSVTLLLSLIFAHNRQNRIDSAAKNNEPNAIEIFKSVVFYAIIIIIILGTIISSICLSFAKDCSDPHIIYILSPGEYNVVEKIITSDSIEKNEKQPFYEFTFEDKLYHFEYDEKLKHGTKLYFCEKHEALE